MHVGCRFGDFTKGRRLERAHVLGLVRHFMTAGVGKRFRLLIPPHAKVVIPFVGKIESEMTAETLPFPQEHPKPVLGSGR